MIMPVAVVENNPVGTQVDTAPDPVGKPQEGTPLDTQTKGAATNQADYSGPRNKDHSGYHHIEVYQKSQTQ